MKNKALSFLTIVDISTILHYGGITSPYRGASENNMPYAGCWGI